MKPVDEQQLAEREMVRNCIIDLGSRMNALSTSFYTHLFRLDPSQLEVFADKSAVTLNRKFINMMATLKSIKDLEKMTPSIENLAKRHFSYGMKLEHLSPFADALILALSEQLGERFSESLKQAWLNVYHDIAEIMKSAAEKNPDWISGRIHYTDSHKDLDLLRDIGGEEVIRRVHTRLYNALFDHPWLEQFFYGKNKDALISKQTKFMLAAFGGPNEYVGEPTALAHMHMLITEEMALEREAVLRKAMQDEGLSNDIVERWLKIDRSFWPSIIKRSVDECVTKCFGQAPLVIKTPAKFRA